MALYCRVAQPQGGEYAEGALWRVGAVVGALWLAHPQLLMLPKWLLATLLGTMLIVSWRPKVLLIAIPIVIAIALLRPRRGKSIRRVGKSSPRTAEPASEERSRR